MVNKNDLRQRQHAERVVRRHMQRAQAYVEGKKIIREMSYKDMPWMSVPFKPVHYYMHLLPGFNTHFVPAKYVGWRRTRAVDVYPDPHQAGFVRIEFNANYLANRKF